MRKQNSTFKTAFTSEADRNLKNTDSFGYVELDKYACYVIADGIDDQVDATSAKLAVDTIISAFTEAPSIRKSALRRYLRSANEALLTADSRMHLKASITVIVTNYVNMRYGQAGNTRFRLYRDGFLRAQSSDQSLSMDLVAADKLAPDKLAQHQERHNLYCYLGQEERFCPFVSKKLKLSDSDAAALMTRGVWEHLDDGILKDAFADASDEPQETVDAVEDILLSMQPKDLGAYTFVAIFFNKTYNDPNRKRKIKRAIMIAIPIVLVLTIVSIILVVYFHKRQKKIESMEQSFYNTIEYIQADNYVRAKEECQKALDIAEDLSDKEIQEDAGNYMKLIESVLAGDDALTNGEYTDAQRNFLNARNRTRYADNLGLDYIDDRLEQTSQYMSVYELISLGDTLAQGHQYDKAEDQYLAAKALAAQLYFDVGRDDALAALGQMYTDQSAQQAQEDEEVQEAAQAQTSAASIVAEGDIAFSKGDYEGARAFYTTALQKYTELEDQAQINVINVKLNNVNSKLTAQSALISEAEGYMRQAESQYIDKNYVQAKKYYLLAKNVYTELEDDSKVAEITRRLELIEMGINEEEQATSEPVNATEVPEDTAGGTEDADEAPGDTTGGTENADEAPEDTASGTEDADDSIPPVLLEPSPSEVIG